MHRDQYELEYGSDLRSQSGYAFLGQSRGEISLVFIEIEYGSAVQNETLHDSLPPPPPPPVPIVPHASPYVLHGHSEVGPPTVVPTTVSDDAHARMDRIEQCMR
ncbi:hypothetical protein CK203_096537 [Vitis vinifera]|uniref:Uncharacterized protein n=1 Tax=Vitis vinifera TaxID=29760 RepID=A0A438E3E5_VITVI|nr:hypothetical protein CK203_096537 [Vitis vinifera]